MGDPILWVPTISAARSPSSKLRFRLSVLQQGLANGQRLTTLGVAAWTMWTGDHH